MDRHRHRGAARLLGAALAATFWSGTLAAQQASDTIEPRLGPSAASGVGAPEFAYGLSLGIQRDTNRQRLDEVDRDHTPAEAYLSLGVRQRIGRRTSMLADAELVARQTPDSDDDEGDDREVAFTIERLYIQQEDLATTRRLRFGRQSLGDDMGWIIDENLDGIRFTTSRGKAQLDASFTRESWFELATEDREDIIYNAYVSAPIDASDDARWMPWVLHRSEREFADARAAETTWIGLQGIVRLNEAFRYWVNAVARTGEEARPGSGNALGGLAVDLGATWTIDQPLRPALTFGYASSSGDPDADDGTDDTFRQSGLHTNEFELNDRNRFRYLGEVVDPELTNLEVLTVGLGLQFSRRWSADVAWHSYRQVEEEAILRGTDLDYGPAGEDDDLGRALDVVLGYRRSETLELMAVAGRFESGGAFPELPDPAWLLRLEMEWSFGR